MKTGDVRFGVCLQAKEMAASFFIESFPNYTERQDQLGKERQEEPGYRYQRRKIQN